MSIYCGLIVAKPIMVNRFSFLGLGFTVAMLVFFA